jgi:hypothetical protein
MWITLAQCPRAAPAFSAPCSAWGHQVAHTHFGGHVGGQRHARAQRRQFGGGGVAGCGLARRDVDTRASAQEAGRDHAADAARTTGDQGRAARQGEELVHATFLKEASAGA